MVGDEMIIKIEINKIDGKNKASPTSELRVNSVPTIESVEKKTLVGIDQETAAINFMFKTTYGSEEDAEKFGKIELHGTLFYRSDNVDNLIKNWNETKALPKDDALEILNGIFRFSLMKIINYSNDLLLPPPVKFPSVNVKVEDDKKQE